MFYESKKFGLNILQTEEKFSATQLLLLLLGVICAGAMFGILIIQGVGFISGKNVTITNEISFYGSEINRNFIRFILLINHLTMFCLPVILLAGFIFSSAWSEYLGLNKVPKIKYMLLGVLLILSSFPMIQFIYTLNQQLILPDWIKTIEENTDDAIKGLLQCDSIYELIINILVIGLVPAIGEEMIFRGWIQRQISRLVRQQSASIWLSAIIFSAIHFQFSGFFPRMILGALLGYLYYWTGNLWVAIFAHFANNSAQLLAHYFFGEQFDNLDKSTTQIPVILYFLSFSIFALVARFFYKDHLENIKQKTIKL